MGCNFASHHWNLAGLQLSVSVQLIGIFLWGFACGLLGLVFEVTGQVLRYAGNGLMRWSDVLMEQSFESANKLDLSSRE